MISVYKSKIDSDLVKKQKLTEEEVKKLEELHIIVCKLAVDSHLTKNYNKIKEIAYEMVQLEYAMQYIWKFKLDKQYHNHKVNICGCSCYKYDGYYPVCYVHKDINFDINRKFIKDKFGVDIPEDYK